MEQDPFSSDVRGAVDPSTIFEKALELGKAGQWHDAIRYYDLYLAIHPWSANAFNNKADCLSALGETGKAREIVLWALTLDPRLHEAWCTLGELQAIDGETFSARLSIETSLRLKAPDHPLYAETERHLRALGSSEY